MADQPQKPRKEAPLSNYGKLKAQQERDALAWTNFLKGVAFLLAILFMLGGAFDYAHGMYIPGGIFALLTIAAMFYATLLRPGH